MVNLMPEQIQEMHVGDTGRTLSWVVTKANRKEARDLTGYSAWVSFWNRDAEPHASRSATLDPANGLIYYTLRGDEFTEEGLTFCQYTLRLADWYIGTAPGRAGVCTSGKIVKVRTMRRPS